MMSGRSLQSVQRRSSAAAQFAAVTCFVLMLTACSTDATLAPNGVADPPRIALSVAHAKGQEQCVPDSKLIGLVELSTADVPGTWWYITRQGFDAAGVTDYLAFIETVFGQDFADLSEAVSYLVSAAAPFDVNGNGYLCAYETRGTRSNYRLPNVSLYIFYIWDDRDGSS